MRLIDECKEEEDRLQVINNEEDHEVQAQIDKQKEQSENQLVKYEQVNQVLAQSDEIAAKAK